MSPERLKVGVGSIPINGNPDLLPIFSTLHTFLVGKLLIFFWHRLGSELQSSADSRTVFVNYSMAEGEVKSHYSRALNRALQGMLIGEKAGESKSQPSPQPR